MHGVLHLKRGTVFRRDKGRAHVKNRTQHSRGTTTRRRTAGQRKVHFLAVCMASTEASSANTMSPVVLLMQSVSKMTSYPALQLAFVNMGGAAGVLASTMSPLALLKQSPSIGS